MDNKKSKILILGSTGLVGGAILARLKKQGFNNLISPNRSELNLFDSQEITRFFQSHRPEYIFMSAAKVGGIQANINSPADFGFENGMININVIDAAYRAGVKKMLFLGSSCIYPKYCQQPMKEEYLLTGRCEPTNELYALSKIYGMKLCEAYNIQYGTEFITSLPCNIYGIGDHFNPLNSHVVGALIYKFHQAKEEKKSEIILWGTGNARRELMFVQDLADASLFLMQNYQSNNPINVGTGEDHTIREIAEIVKDIVGYKGEIIWDTSRPEGMMQKLLDVSQLHRLGWSHRISLEEGIRKSYAWYLSCTEKRSKVMVRNLW